MTGEAFRRIYIPVHRSDISEQASQSLSMQLFVFHFSFFSKRRLTLDQGEFHQEIEVSLAIVQIMMMVNNNDDDRYFRTFLEEKNLSQNGTLSCGRTVLSPATLLAIIVVLRPRNAR